MLTIKTTEYIDPYISPILSIRETVFCLEQGVDINLEIDGLDEFCIHSLAFWENKPIATGRIQKDGHIGRIAVLKEYRGKGFGSKIIVSLTEQAQSFNLASVYLEAQISAIPFYQKLGFQEFGSVFIEANIDHTNMKRLLSG